MKTLQKATLAAAIAAAPFFAVNAMEALDDDVLSEMTGQAGVTIETTTSATGTSIGSVEYTDTDGYGTTGDGGSVYIKNIVNKSAGSGNVVEKQTIDVDTWGNLIIQSETVSTDNKLLTIDEVRIQSKDQATSGPNGSNTGADGALLVSNLSMEQVDGGSQTHILNLTETDNAYGIANYGIKDIATIKSDIASNTQGTNDVKMAIVTKSVSKIEDLDVDVLDGAIEIRDLKYYDPTASDGMMTSTQVIWAKGGAAANGGGVYIQGSDSVGTLEIGSIGIGGGTIGSVKISNIDQSGSVQRIYGH